MQIVGFLVKFIMLHSYSRFFEFTPRRVTDLIVTSIRVFSY